MSDPADAVDHQANLARYHLGENVRRPDEEFASRIADAPAEFWVHVRNAFHALPRLRATCERLGPAVCLYVPQGFASMSTPKGKRV